MRTLLEQMEIALQPGEAVSLKSEGAHLLVVHEADTRSLWLTRNGDSYDYWLGAGDSFELGEGDTLTLSAEGISTVAMSIVVLPCATLHANGTARVPAVSFAAMLAANAKRFVRKLSVLRAA